MRLVAFEGARQSRDNLADEVSRHLDDLRRGRSEGLGNHAVNPVPGEHLVAGDVEGLAEGVVLPSSPARPRAKSDEAVRVHGVWPSSWTKTGFPCSRRAAKV